MQKDASGLGRSGIEVDTALRQWGTRGQADMLWKSTVKVFMICLPYLNMAQFSRA